jgi:hypothetical protein
MLQATIKSAENAIVVSAYFESVLRLMPPSDPIASFPNE